MDWETGIMQVDPEEIALAGAVAFSSAATMRLLKEHWEVNEQLLSHVYFCELVTWIEKLLEDVPFSDDVVNAIKIIDNGFSRNIATNMIYVSFIDEFALTNAIKLTPKLQGFGPLLYQQFKERVSKWE